MQPLHTNVMDTCNRLNPALSSTMMLEILFHFSAPGETAVIAEEMAARDAIKNLLNTSESRVPLLLGDKLRDLELDYNKVNRSVNDVMSK